MPSPFSGMDPFLEGPTWPDFHNSYLVALRAVLTAKLLPRYLVILDERVVLEPLQGDEPHVFVVDVGVSRGESAPVMTAPGPGVAVLEPTVLPQPRFLKVKELFLRILDAESREVVTVIELLSPSNKTARERNEYLAKRDRLLEVGVNLLELDLLRGGRRIPTSEPLPPGDYYAFLSRAARPAEVSVFAWTIRDRLPTLPVPLRGEEPDVTVDFQAVFDRTFEEGGFGYRLRYDDALSPSLPASTAAWIRERLAAYPPRS